MKRALAVAALACAALQASAYEACGDAGKRKALDRDSREIRKALPDRQFTELDRRFSGMLVALDKGVLDDATADRAFRTFEALDLGDCARCGSRDPAPLLREWGRQYPRSPAARVALAYHAVSLGYAVRDKAGKQPAPAALEGMNAAFREAVDAMAEADRMGPARMLTSALRIRIAAASPAVAGGTATEIYRKAIAADPRNATARVRYAEASQPKWGGSRKQVESILRDIAGLDAGDVKYVQYAVHQMAGAAAEAARDDKSAARHYGESVALCPGLTNAAARLAELQVRTRDYKGAVVTATSLIEGDRTNGWARALRGQAHRELRQYKESYADYESATELGYRSAFEQLAWFHETGTYVPRDARRALELYGIAADADSATARASVARLREKGV